VQNEMGNLQSVGPVTYKVKENEVV
jgi:hypothetical protein